VRPDQNRSAIKWIESSLRNRQSQGNGSLDIGSQDIGSQGLTQQNCRNSSQIAKKRWGITHPIANKANFTFFLVFCLVLSNRNNEFAENCFISKQRYLRRSIKFNPFYGHVGKPKEAVSFSFVGIFSPTLDEDF